MIKNAHWSLWEVTFILVIFELSFIFLGMCSKNTETSNFMKIRPLAVELFHSDGRKDGRKGRQA